MLGVSLDLSEGAVLGLSARVLLGLELDRRVGRVGVGKS